jgi:putative peptidoglycan lipid II flippase
MAAVAIFGVVGGAARVGQDAAIAWRFGTGPTVDAFYFLFTLAGWPLAVALSVLSVLVAPVDARLRSSDPQAARRFRAELLGSALAVAVAALPLAWWAMQAIAGSAAGGLDARTAAQASAGANGLALMVPLGLVGALLSAWLVAEGRHVLALLEGLPYFFVLALVLMLPGPVLFWGTSIGVALQVLAMAWVLRRSGAMPAPSWSRSSHYWQSFSQGAWILLVAQALFSLVPLIDTFFAARLGEGAVSALSYTNRLVLGLQGLAGLALQRSGLPLLSALSAHSQAATRRAALRWALAMGALGALGGLLVAVLADPIVSLLFERGSFTAADRAQCATLLRYGMLQMPLFLAAMALVTALASASARHALALVAVVNVAVKLLASVLLVPVLGVPALMLSSACMYGAAAVVAWLALRRHLQPADS